MAVNISKKPLSVVHWRAGHLERWGFLYVLLGSAIAAAVGNNYANDSPFAHSSPTQYGRVMLGLHLAGFASAAGGYMLLVLELMEESCLQDIWRKAAAVIAMVALVLAGYALTETWSKHEFDSPPGWDEWIAVIFAGVSLIAVSIAAIGSSRVKWRARLYVIEGPLFLSLCAIVIGKYFLYETSTIDFNEWITKLPYYPKSKSPGWENTAVSIRGNLRGAFWFGIITGVISVQLIAAQVAAWGLSRILDPLAASERNQKKDHE